MKKVKKKHKIFIFTLRYCSGVAANCASALAQMAAASCIQEDKEVGETGDAISQGTMQTSHMVIRSFISFTLNKDWIWSVFLQSSSVWNTAWSR